MAVSDLTSEALCASNDESQSMLAQQLSSSVVNVASSVLSQHENIVAEASVSHTGKPTSSGSTSLQQISGCPMSSDKPASGIVSSPVAAGSAKKKKTRYREREFDELYVATGETLGQGAFGDVRTFRWIETGAEYAVKLVTVTKKRSRDKVLREIEILMHCRQHPNIVNIWQFFEKSPTMILVFEKLIGGTLINNAWSQKSLTEEDVSQAIKNIADGLHFLHRLGVAHRDLKPDNIVCVSRESLVPLKLIDFDLASDLVISKQDTSAFVTTPRLCSPVGSTDFMAPEVVRMWQGGCSRSSYDKRCDLWSLGVILYLLLCGYMPFRDVRCGDSHCGWDRGKKCEKCQSLTFELIQNGKYTFPDAEWHSVSLEAKELVAKLLVRNPWSRFLAADVLRHVWLSDEFAHERSGSTLLPSRDTVENISACVDSLTVASHQLAVDVIVECEEHVTAASSSLRTNFCHLSSAVQDLVVEEIERDCVQNVEDTGGQQSRPVSESSEDSGRHYNALRPCTADHPPGHVLVNIDSDFISSILVSPRDDNTDDGLLFRMSDVEDAGIVDWSVQDVVEAERDSVGVIELPALVWCGNNSLATFDEDVDSGNGNSADSGRLFDCFDPSMPLLLNT